MSLYARFSTIYERLFPFRDEVYRLLLEHAGSCGTRVLDIGCGPGHYCNRFACDGYDACGIDPDEGMITAARLHYPACSFIPLDCTGLSSFSHQCSLIYSVGNVLSHCRPGDLPELLSLIRSRLAPGGHWVFQIVNWDYLLQQSDYVFPVRNLDNGYRFERRYSRIAADGVSFCVTLHQYDRVLFSDETTLYPVTSTAMLSLHEAAGFTLQGCYADFMKGSFISGSDSGMVMVFSVNRSNPFVVVLE